MKHEFWNIFLCYYAHFRARLKSCIIIHNLYHKHVNQSQSLEYNFRQFDMLHDYLNFVSDVNRKMTSSGQKMAFELL